jgi:hypothetical protein
MLFTIIVATMMPTLRCDASSDSQINDVGQLPLATARCGPETKLRKRNRYVAKTD